MNLIARSHNIKVDRDILDILKNISNDSYSPVGTKKEVKPLHKCSTLGVKYSVDKLSGSPLSFLREKLGILYLTKQFKYYLNLNMIDLEDILYTKRVLTYSAYYCYALSVLVV